MSLIEKVTEQITNSLTFDLAEFLADRFGLDSNEVSDAVKDYLGHNSTPVPKAQINKPLQKKSPPIKPSNSGIKTCQFKITRGDKAGSYCGTAIRGNSDFCSKHKNRKAVLTVEKEKKKVIRDQKAKRWIIDGTKYVVKSPHDIIIIGKLVGSKFRILTEDDKKKIKQLKIPIDEGDEYDEEEIDDSIIDDFDDN